MGGGDGYVVRRGVFGGGARLKRYLGENPTRCVQ